MSWRPRSVRLRLTLWYMAALSAILLLYAGGVLVFVRHRLYRELDRRLHEQFETAEHRLRRVGTDGLSWHESGSHHDEKGEPKQHGVQVWSREGRLLLQRGWPDRTAIGAGFSQRMPPETVRLAGGERCRQLTGPYSIGGLAVVIRVTRSESPLQHELGELLLVMILGLPFAVGIAGVGGYLLARRALAPVGRMVEKARTISADRLSERLAVEDPEDELGGLATVFNEVFSRLEQSFDELRRFTADASHELRTPLTAIRSVGEVGLRERRDEDAYREIIGSMLEEADRLNRLVDSLLTLARAEGRRKRLKLEPADLGDLAREVAEHLGALAEERGQSISVEADGRVEAAIDRLVLRQALINLLDNAIKYSPEGGRIRIALNATDRERRLEVIDEGAGIPLEHRQRVFDRFYRVDQARSREMGGTGLGLSITRWAVEAHGGRVELECPPGQGCIFRVVLPQPEPQERSDG